MTRPLTVGSTPDESSDELNSVSQKLEYTFNPDSPRILVVDDEKVIREILADFLTMEGYVVHTVEDGAQALEELHKRSYNLVISDLKMPNMGGLELIQKITEESIPVLTVIMTGFGTVETAIEAMKKGAYDYILKPFKVEEVIHIVQRGLDRQRLQHENIRLKDALSIYKISEAIATSLSVEKVLDLVLDATHRRRRRRRRQPAARGSQAATGRFIERMRKVSRARRAGHRGAAAEPRRGAAALPGGPAAAGARQPRRTASSRRRRRSRTAPGQLLLHPAQAQRPHHRHAQRLQLHARQQVQRGPAQDAVRARQPRRRLDRERAPLREPGRRQQGSDPRQRLAGGELQADHHRLRARARGVGPLHPRPLRARRHVRAPHRHRPAAERRRRSTPSSRSA